MKTMFQHHTVQKALKEKVNSLLNWSFDARINPYAEPKLSNHTELLDALQNFQHTEYWFHVNSVSYELVKKAKKIFYREFKVALNQAR